MARRPKAIQPVDAPVMFAEMSSPADEPAATPARRGRKPKTVVPSLGAANSGEVGEGAVGADHLGDAGASDAPVRGRRGRKPKEHPAAAAGLPLQSDATPTSGRRGRKNRQAELAAELDPAENGSQAAASMLATSATPPADEAPTPIRRGRKPKLSASPLEAASDVEDGEVADGDEAEASKAPVQKRRGRKPKKTPAGAAAAQPKGGRKAADGRRGRKPRLPEQAEEPDPAENTASIDVVANDADADPVKRDAAPVSKAPSPGERAKSISAATWDRTTDTVYFDWPAIEATASQSGPNQGIAKLLIAARAEGAGSRWPL